MEIEHINDDTIRVRIETSDLEARGYSFLDLLGNQKHIETFFYSILEEVDIDEEFQESDAVTFQVMPNRDGLELFISKNTDMHENLFENIDFHGYEDDTHSNQDYSRFEANGKSNKREDTAAESANNESENYKLVIEFSHFEQVVELSKMFQIESGFSSLYQFNGKYYLELTFLNDELSLRTPQEETAVVLEFGVESRLSPDVLIEHGNLVIEDVALETVKFYFN